MARREQKRRRDRRNEEDEGIFGSRALIFIVATLVIYFMIKDVNITGQLESMLEGTMKVGTVTHSFLEILRSYRHIANALSASIMGLYVTYLPVSY